MSEADLPQVRRVRWYHALVPLVTSQVMAVVAFFALAVWRVVRGFSPAETVINWFATDFIANSLMVIASSLTMLGLSLWFLSGIKDPALPARFRPLQKSGILLGLGAGAALVLASSLFEYLCDTFLHTNMAQVAAGMPFMPHRLGQLPFGIFCVVLLGPLAEEVTFRGLVMGWVHRHWGRWAAVIVSALVFGGLHLQWLNGGLTGWMITADLCVAGVVLALVAMRTGSLWASFFAHAVLNLTAAILIVLFYRT